MKLIFFPVYNLFKGVQVCRLEHVLVGVVNISSSSCILYSMWLLAAAYRDDLTALYNN